MKRTLSMKEALKISRPEMRFKISWKSI